MATVNEMNIDDWMEIMQDYEDPYHNLPIHQTINVPPVLNDATECTNKPTNTVTFVTDNDALGSVLIDGQRQSAQTPAPRRLTEASFNNKSYSNAVTPVTEDDALGSILIDGQCQSDQTPAPRRLTKASFNNKSYSNGYYKDSTIHITTDSGHNANHSLPIDPDPLMHVSRTALVH
jgi:hypothetical protein